MTIQKLLGKFNSRFNRRFEVAVGENNTLILQEGNTVLEVFVDDKATHNLLLGSVKETLRELCGLD